MQPASMDSDQDSWMYQWEEQKCVCVEGRDVLIQGGFPYKLQHKGFRPHISLWGFKA